MRIAVNQEQKVLNMLEKGMNYKTVAEATNNPAWVIKFLIKDLRREEIENNSSSAVFRWLKANWRWKVQEPVRKISKDGYRIVRKGEKGIRTPYKPDGIFR